MCDTKSSGTDAASGCCVTALIKDPCGEIHMILQDKAPQGWIAGLALASPQDIRHIT